MRCRLADNIKELSHKAETVSSGVEERFDISGDLNLISGKCQEVNNQTVTLNTPHSTIL